MNIVYQEKVFFEILADVLIVSFSASVDRRPSLQKLLPCKTTTGCMLILSGHTILNSRFCIQMKNFSTLEAFCV